MIPIILIPLFAIFFGWLIYSGTKKTKPLYKKFTIVENSISENSVAYIVFLSLNSERQKKGLNRLANDDYTSMLAYNRVTEIWESGEVDHTLMGDERKELIELGADSVGEILAYGYNDIPSLIKAWMESDRHREVILNPSYQWCGVSTGLTKEGKTLYCVIFGGDNEF